MLESVKAVISVIQRLMKFVRFSGLYGPTPCRVRDDHRTCSDDDDDALVRLLDRDVACNMASSVITLAGRCSLCLFNDMMYVLILDPSHRMVRRFLAEGVVFGYLS